MVVPVRDNNARHNAKWQRDIGWDEMDRARSQIPKPIRDWLEFEAPVPFDPTDVLRHKATPKNADMVGFFIEPVYRTWAEVFAELKMIAANDHREAFNGVHPGLDRARRVW